MAKKKVWWALSEAIVWAATRDDQWVASLDPTHIASSILAHKVTAVMDPGSARPLRPRATKSAPGSALCPAGELFDTLLARAKKGGLRVRGRLISGRANVQRVPRLDFDNLKFQYTPDGLQNKDYGKLSWDHIEFRSDDLRQIWPPRPSIGSSISQTLLANGTSGTSPRADYEKRFKDHYDLYGRAPLGSDSKITPGEISDHRWAKDRGVRRTLVEGWRKKMISKLSVPTRGRRTNAAIKIAKANSTNN
jgi:hypothetical protein